MLDFKTSMEIVGSVMAIVFVASCFGDIIRRMFGQWRHSTILIKQLHEMEQEEKNEKQKK